MEKLILALDCSLRWTNVAVFLGGGVLISERHDIGRRQAAELPLIVKDALSSVGRSFEQVGLLAVTNGPGYFTGIRVGVSYAAALAYGLGVKVAPVSTLHMLASRRMERAPLLVVVYAGRERVYAASFGCEDELPTGEYKKEEIEKWLSIHEKHENVEVVSDDPGKTFLTGLGLEVLQVLPDASDVARIAWRFPAAAVHPMELKVSYHRNPS